MTPRNRALTALASLSMLILGLAILTGCGGGGGGGGGGTTNASTVTDNYLYYGVTSTSSPTLSPGDQVTLSATAEISGVTSQLSPYNFVVQGGASVGTVTTTGLFTAGTGVTAGTKYTITAISSVGIVSWSFVGAAPLAQPVVVGIVQASVSQGGVAGAVITAYDAHNNVVGTATTSSNGAFSLPVTTAATQFGLSIGGVSQTVMTYYEQFGYGTGEYDTTNPACLPALPTITSGNHHYALSYPVILNTDVYDGISYPPPPPVACFG